MNMNKSITELHEMLINGNVTSEELVRDAINEAHHINDKINAFVTIVDDAKSSEVTDDLLSGIPCAVKDNLSTKGILSTGGSNTLKDYVPFYDATAVRNLQSHGAIVTSKTTMDELGMGGTGTTGHTGVQKNPWDLTRSVAGSSSGSAAAVAAGVIPYALGSDSGDSIRKPAAYCGIVGYKPTYGMVSRYGLFAYASSLDTVGVLTRNVRDAAIVVDGMKGIDKNDMTSWDSSYIHLNDDLTDQVDGKKLFYIKEICDIENYENPSDELKMHLENFKNTLNICKDLGMSVEGVSINKKLLNALPSVYEIIAYAEATSNMSNLTGFIFGPRGKGDNYIEMMKDHRTNGFSSFIKRRFIIGSYVLQAENQEKYFKNAQRVRRMIVDKIKGLFKEYDAYISPVGIGPAKLLEENRKVDEYTKILDEQLQIGNYGGFPSITIPNGFVTNLPVGINVTCNCYEDQMALNIAYALEGKMNYKNQIAKEVGNE